MSFNEFSTMLIFYLILLIIALYHYPQWIEATPMNFLTARRYNSDTQGGSYHHINVNYFKTSPDGYRYFNVGVLMASKLDSPFDLERCGPAVDLALSEINLKFLKQHRIRLTKVQGRYVINFIPYCCFFFFFYFFYYNLLKIKRRYENVIKKIFYCNHSC